MILFNRIYKLLKVISRSISAETRDNPQQPPQRAVSGHPANDLAGDTKKGRAKRPHPVSSTGFSTQSGRDDVLRLRALLALRDGELYLLAFRQRFEAVAGDIAVVCKYVRTRFLLDEAIAFGIVKPFNSAGYRSGHGDSLFNQE